MASGFGLRRGTPGFRFTVASGVLPPGLALDESSGVLSGTPASDGAFMFTVGTSDSTGCAAARTYSLDVPACAFVLNQSSVSLRARGEPWLISIANPCGDWMATSLAPWIEVAATTSSAVIIVAAPNTSPASRSGHVTVGPRVFTVHQSGCTGTFTGFERVLGENGPLPIGSTLDAGMGVFTWVPGPAFNGTYQLTFSRDGCAAGAQQVSLEIAARP